jgi:predicted dehydrogenase
LPFDKTRVAVFGAGAFGQNHIRVYRQLDQDGHPVHLAAVIDPAFTGDHRQELNLPPDVRLFTTPEACLAAHLSGELPLDAASICTPTSTHAAVAAAALDAGLHTLVEKPITRTLAEADDLIARAAAHGLVLQVGHLERFNPAIRAFVPYLNHPMFFEAHRLSIFTPRSLDVDVVLDLMVHDLDIVLAFAQSPVQEVRAVGLPILSSKTDIANVRVEFESGCVANFTASRVSTERVRKLRFFQPHQYVSIDYARQEILIIETTPEAAPTPGPSTLGAPSSTRSGAVGTGGVGLGAPPSTRSGAVGTVLNLPGLKLTKPTITPGEPLRLEIESFLSAIKTRTTPVVSGQDGRAALALALDITAAIDAHNTQHRIHAPADPLA